MCNLFTFEVTDRSAEEKKDQLVNGGKRCDVNQPILHTVVISSYSVLRYSFVARIVITADLLIWEISG